MGWAVGYDETWERDIGYCVPSVCDHPQCATTINRGLSYVCGGDPYGGQHGCGLFFCAKHRQFHEFRNGDCKGVCPRCAKGKSPYKHPKPDTTEWVLHKLTDETWSVWREVNPDDVAALRKGLSLQHSPEQK